MIWKRQATLEQLNRLGEGNMVGLLDIRFETVTDDTLEATMPVDSRTQQPFGLLHGGASVVLAETLGSVAGYLCIIYGIIFVILGIPLLEGQNTPYVLLSVIGVIADETCQTSVSGIFVAGDIRTKNLRQIITACPQDVFMWAIM